MVIVMYMASSRHVTKCVKNIQILTVILLPVLLCPVYITPELLVLSRVTEDVAQIVAWCRNLYCDNDLIIVKK